VVRLRSWGTGQMGRGNGRNGFHGNDHSRRAPRRDAANGETKDARRSRLEDWLVDQTRPGHGSVPRKVGPEEQFGPGPAGLCFRPRRATGSLRMRLVDPALRQCCKWELENLSCGRIDPAVGDVPGLEACRCTLARDGRSFERAVPDHPEDTLWWRLHGHGHNRPA
jgi:hypothetical protein